ncbi:MAG: hypothetical protein JNM58_00825 [Xanthomonadaceae bacterium]|nr:hypothetical protein [Xanthomonadaceae bacterium]
MSKTPTTGTLKHGLKIGQDVHRDFEFRADVTAEDYFAAEDEAKSNDTLRFRAALTARQLARIGTFTGPFNSSLLGKLKPADLAQLMRVREALEEEGNAEPSGGLTS